MLRRLDKGPPTTKQRIFLFPWIGGTADGYAAVASNLPKDIAIFALDMPGHGDDRTYADGYPTADFALKVIVKTLLKEVKKPGLNYFFGHDIGAHMAYYTAKQLAKEQVPITALFVSGYMVPAAFPKANIASLQWRQNTCIPLRIFIGMIKQGYDIDPKLGHRSHMGNQGYQGPDYWAQLSRGSLMDYWTSQEFPLPGADEKLSCPIVAFRGKDSPHDNALVRESLVIPYIPYGWGHEAFMHCMLLAVGTFSLSVWVSVLAFARLENDTSSCSRCISDRLSMLLIVQQARWCGSLSLSLYSMCSSNTSLYLSASLSLSLFLSPPLFDLTIRRCTTTAPSIEDCLWRWGVSALSRCS